MRLRSKRSVVLAFAVSTAACGLALPAASEAAFPGKNGRIAVTVQPLNEWRVPLWSRIETVLPNGRDRRVLGTCLAEATCSETDPSWSPDGRLLAFVRGPGWQGRLAVVRDSGTGLRQLPQLTQSDGQPAWSRTGRRLAFIGSPDGPRLYTVRRDGTDLRQVTSRYARSPAWSRKGVIAFTHDDDPYGTSVPDDGIYTIGPDGSQQRLTVRDRHNASVPDSPDWSPHGSRVAFSFADSPDPDIHVADAKGRRDRRLTRRGGEEPAWSPDGRYIAFIRHGDLFVMRSDGSGLRLVADGGNLETGEEIYLASPSWQALPR